MEARGPSTPRAKARLADLPILRDILQKNVASHDHAEYYLTIVVLGGCWPPRSHGADESREDRADEDRAVRSLCRAVAVATALLVFQPRGQCTDILAADRPIAEVVDHYIDAALRKENVLPASQAGDAAFARRLTIDLAGRIPTAAESRAFIESTDTDKRAHLVDRLMGSPGFVRHQANELDTMLMAGSKGSLRDYLVAAVGENRPWDQVFRELMLPDQTDKVQRVAAEYLRQRIKDLDRLTADVSSTFFGVNISCAQCHDHPLVHDWKQDHFFGMKSFLSRTFVTGGGSGGFLAERGTGTIRFKTTDDVEKSARMMFLTGTRVEQPDDKEAPKEEQKKEKDALERSRKEKHPPPPPRFSARAKLVEVALQPGDRDFFARAIVNRIWHRLFGHGLVMPLDQMHSANPPTHPELLAWLARDTVAHGYDLRRLIRGLVVSAAYSRGSRWEHGEPPRPALFAVAAVRLLTPMQLATSLRLATIDPASLPADVDSTAFAQRIETIEQTARSLAPLFTNSGGDSQVGVAEALLFSNAKRISSDLLADGPDRLVTRLKQTSSRADLIDLAVRTILSRPPDPDDIQNLGAYLASRTDRPAEACEQLAWALLTCSEFRFNH
jgi:hypothetical protein